jgi:hypothetical protein
VVKAVLTGFSTSLALRSGILCGQQAVIGNLGRIRPRLPDQAAEWQIQQPNKIFIASIFSIPILLLV